MADALRAQGFAVTADPALSGAEELAAARAFLRAGLDVLLDDGAHLIRLAHDDDPSLVAGWIGACEETTSGLTPLRRMQDAGILRTAVMAVNDARTKTMFDNRYGTGQSCVFAIADLLEERGSRSPISPRSCWGTVPSVAASRPTCARSAPRCGSPRPIPYARSRPGTTDSPQVRRASSRPGRWSSRRPGCPPR